MKKLVFRLGQLLCLTFFWVMLLQYSLVLKYAKEGLLVWFSHVLPLLLPFIILSKFWIRYQIPELFFSRAKRVFPAHADISVSLPIFLLGLCSGFPIGAIFISHYYQNQTLSKQQAEVLLPLASFLSPMFVMGYIHSQLHIRYSQWFIYLLALYLPTIICYLFTYFFAKLQKEKQAKIRLLILSRKTFSEKILSEKKPTKSNRYFSNIHMLNKTAPALSLTEEIWIPSIKIICVIGIYMMIFSILSGMLLRFSLFQTPILTFLLANLEITTGIHLLATNKLYSIKVIYALTATAASFGGMCTMAQVQTVISDTDLSLKKYVQIKLLAAGITLLLCMLLF